MGIESKTKKGKLFIVGTGPGGIEHITPAAIKTIRDSNIIVGYEKYISLIDELLDSKEVIATKMTKEKERCKIAIEKALNGNNVAIVSGGDPGIYAMAGLVLEMLKVEDRGQKIEIDVEVVPGISALSACAARLGAPLMHDFASISLSDRLTSWKVIEKRLRLASEADLVIVLYNPKSKGRPDLIDKARDIIMSYRSAETPVGIVRSAYREDERIKVTDLKDMLDHNIGMQTTVIIGNSHSFSWKHWIITPRGYSV